MTILGFLVFPWIVGDDLHHLCDEVLHVVGPLPPPGDHLLMVGIDPSVVLNNTHVGDQTAGKHLFTKHCIYYIFCYNSIETTLGHVNLGVGCSLPK